MHADPPRLGTRRIAVALDASAQGQRLLDLAAGVAALLEAELEGVFVEDTQLLQAAHLPFLRELRRASLDEPALDAARLQRELRAVAKRVQEDLERSARTRGLACTFRVWRGDPAAEILAAGVGAELFALGLIGRYAPAVQPRREGRTAPAAAGLTLGVLIAGGETAARGLAMAAELARDRRAEVCVILPPGQRPETQAQAARLLDLLSASGTEAQARCVATEGEDPGQLARTVRANHIDLLILEATHPLLAAADLWDRLESLGCPLLIHRGGTG